MWFWLVPPLSQSHVQTRLSRTSLSQSRWSSESTRGMLPYIPSVRGIHKSEHNFWHCCGYCIVKIVYKRVFAVVQTEVNPYRKSKLRKGGSKGNRMTIVCKKCITSAQLLETLLHSQGHCMWVHLVNVVNHFYFTVSSLLTCCYFITTFTNHVHVGRLCDHASSALSPSSNWLAAPLKAGPLYTLHKFFFSVHWVRLFRDGQRGCGWVR